LGAILVVEFITLTIWGYLTPGQVIPNVEALAVILGVAIETAAILWIAYTAKGRRANTRIAASSALAAQTTITTPVAKVSNLRAEKARRAVKQSGLGLFTRFTAVFALFLSIGSVSLASVVNSLSNIFANLPFFAIAASSFGISLFVLCMLLKRYVLAYEARVTV
jgi:hypothetical protein